MIKIVNDTNVWVSSIFWRGNPYKIVKLAESGAIEVYISEDILKEIAETLSRERKLINRMESFGLSLHEILNSINHIAKFVDTKEKISEIREDPDDNIILEAACASNSNYIVSGDNHLLKLNRFRGIEIINPNEFLRKL